ncbi:MAG: hypothetical protein U0K91_10875 [Acutalibacteraceae bacterium]|nr:hypothetical protein [Acutalibacteraceae bacterium]
MNNSEIIKAYEEEISKPQNHYIGTVGILWNVLDLIKRQQAEIDRLNIDLKAMRGAANSWKAEVQRICKKEFDNIEVDIEIVKSEAVREFAEKLKSMLSFGRYTSYEQIDNLVKEMTEGKENV